MSDFVLSTEQNTHYTNMFTKLKQCVKYYLFFYNLPALVIDMDMVEPSYRSATEQVMSMPLCPGHKLYQELTAVATFCLSSVTTSGPSGEDNTITR